MRFNFNRQFNLTSQVVRLRVFTIAALAMRIAKQHDDWSVCSLAKCNVAHDFEG